MGFLVSDELVASKVEYIELGDNNVFIVEDGAYKDICKGKKIQIKTILAKFSRPSWGRFNQYIKGTVKDDLQSGESFMDTVLLRQQKFRYLLEEIYEVIEGENVMIPLTESLFDKINTDLAISLIAGYDKALNEERENAANILGLFDSDKKDDKKDGEKDEKKETKKEETEEQPVK